MQFSSGINPKTLHVLPFWGELCHSFMLCCQSVFAAGWEDLLLFSLLGVVIPEVLRLELEAVPMDRQRQE